MQLLKCFKIWILFTLKGSVLFLTEHSSKWYESKDHFHWWLADRAQCIFEQKQYCVIINLDLHCWPCNQCKWFHTERYLWMYMKLVAYRHSVKITLLQLQWFSLKYYQWGLHLWECFYFALLWFDTVFIEILLCENLFK